MISLDFELHWGVRDLYGAEDRRALSLAWSRGIIAKVLELFSEFQISATWAVVGMLFLSGRSEWVACIPGVRPAYENRKLDPYREQVGVTEEEDPLHFAGSLIRQICQVEGQEIASHTFSHYYCLEGGQNEGAFAADVDMALAVARSRGIELRTMVFPRNQHNREYDQILISRNITCFRGSEKNRFYQAWRKGHRSAPYRLYRLVDAYLPLSGPQLVSWDCIPQKNGLCNVPSSRYLRPLTRRTPGPIRHLQLKRITNAMDEAARKKQVFHLWMHPHELDLDPGVSLANLRHILIHYCRCRQMHGMVSLNMAEAARMAMETTKSGRGQEAENGI